MGYYVCMCRIILVVVLPWGIISILFPLRASKLLGAGDYPVQKKLKKK